ncbi:MAG: hypothetical protein K6T74_15175 [Geminicoccaceae bacterium]|nr:hypothetical protein [Geminicoccaceae bacterium]
MAELERLWVYVLARDLGIAPCADAGILTLCTCKPRIRAGASIGDWVLATLPKRFGLGRVAWVGKVAETIETGEFAERWPGRPDSLYRRGPNGELAHRGGTYHAEDHPQKRDLSVRRCLRFEPFWYFGGLGPVLPESLLELCHYGQGQATRALDGERLDLFRRWLARWPPGVLGEPREKEEGERWRRAMPYLAGRTEPGAGALGAAGAATSPPRPSPACGARPAGAPAPRRRSC